MAWCRLNYNKKRLFHPRVQKLRLILELKNICVLYTKKFKTRLEPYRGIVISFELILQTLGGKHTVVKTLTFNMNTEMDWITAFRWIELVTKQHQMTISFLPIFSHALTTATDHHTECTLSPGTFALAKCNNQPEIQYSGVHPTVSSALSHVGTLLSVLRLNRLSKNSRIMQLKKCF